MILVKPSFEILNISYNLLGLIELAGRTCYKSEKIITKDSAKKFVNMLRDRGHESVIEHGLITVKIVCDRGVTHEIVRHRLCAYSQESTRYCNYKGGATFVILPWVNIEPGEYQGGIPVRSFRLSSDLLWFNAMKDAETRYVLLAEEGWTPQQARSILPNSLKTEIVWSTNPREWRHIFKLRCSKAAHPQMREIMIPLHEELKTKVPVLFDDIEY